MPATRESAPPAALWKSIAAAGVFLVLAGFAWQALAPAEVWLSEEDARAHVDAVVAMHGRTMQPSPTDSPELVADRERLAEARAVVEAAQFRQTWWPRALQVAGAVAALVGGIGARAAG